MDRKTRSNVAVGAVLILIGILFLVGQLVPGLWAWVGPFSWPLIIVGVGVLLLVTCTERSRSIGLLVGEPGMAVPACIVGGIGGLLYWQNTTGNWASWAYAWTLIPGFVGIGVMLAGLLGDKPRQSDSLRQNLAGGAWLVLISVILFVIFASFLGGPAVLGQYWRYWPVLLILLGLLLLGRFFVRPRQ
jgi:hypothetical protein